jgi:Carboxypeptidase regulatory-like domain
MRTRPIHFHKPQVVLILILGALFTAALQAQTPLGSISGVITDPSGAVVPAVKVTVRDLERGLSYQGVTNTTGLYRVPDLLPSTYSVTAEKNGFRTYLLRSFPLVTLQKAVLNITLEVGNTKQQVVVTSQVQMVEPSNATLGGLVNNAAVVDLPLVNRNVLQLMAIVPGVMPTTPNSFSSTFFTSAVRYSINGGDESTSQMELDGLSFLNQSDIPGILGLSVLPSVDSVQDFRVQTNDYSASYGRSGGGIVTMVTKSGTNQFHGDAYEFLENNDLEANGFFSNASGATIPPYHYDDYGFTVGGPVIKNHTFFFFSFERNIDHAGEFSLFTVPTMAERNGDFSQDLNAQGQQIVIYNPFTTTPNPASPGTYLRNAFPGNRIPASLMNPVAVKATTYWPAPNLPGTPIPGTSSFTPVNNFGATAVASSPVEMIDFKVDHNFSETKRAFIRYDYFQTVSGDPNLFGNPADEGFGTLTSTGHNATIGYTETFGSGTVLDLRAGFDRFVAYRPSQGLNFNLTTLGLPESLVTYSALGNEPEFPYFGPEGYSSLGNDEGSYYTSHNYDYLGSANLTHIVGRHTLSVGAQTTSFFLNFFQQNPFNAGFSNAMTQGPNPLTVSTTDGDGYASFLLGAGGSGSLADSPQPANANHYFAEYGEDDIKWTPKLTANLGFRIEQETATTERHNRLTAINPLILNPISQDVGFDVYGGYVFAGSGPDSLGRRAIAPIEWKPNPRIGIAYLLDPKTAIRAGYGIFYGVPDDGATDSFTGSTFSTATPYNGSLDGIHPYASLSNPFPNGYVYPSGTSGGLLSAVGTSLGSAWPQALTDMYNQQWNFTIQRNITNDTMLQVAYVGNKATHLGMLGDQIDQLPVKDLSQGEGLLALVPNPFYGYITRERSACPRLRANNWNSRIRNGPV